LLAAAEGAAFNLFLTTDKNMRYQQNLADRRIAVVVLGQQLWPHVRPHILRVVDAVNAATPGSFRGSFLSFRDRIRAASSQSRFGNDDRLTATKTSAATGGS
jgi:hypothetical protein